MSHDIVRDAREDCEDAVKWRNRPRWQPIKTAPKDRSILIGWFRPAGHGLLSTEWNTRCAWWDKDEKAWTDNAVNSWSYEEVQHYQPTHWMPLPAAPI